MVSRRLERLLEENPVSPIEAGLAMELAHGVVRRQRTLDAFMRVFSKRPKSDMPGSLRNILHLGLYQLIFLDRVPDFAAVDQTVSMVRRKFAAQSGYANALLRAVARELSVPLTEPSERLPLSQWLVPLSHTRYRLVEREVFPAPDDDPAGYLAEACSLPDDLARRWLKQRKSPDRAFDLAMHMNLRPPVTARVNLARTTVPALLDDLRAVGVEAKAHANGLNIVLPGHANVAQLAAFQQGLLTPQDATATEVCLALDVQPGMRVLDFCAAPGTKTTHIAELLRGQGEIVAVDVNPEKLARIEQAAQRCGFAVRTCPADQVISLEPASFDRVLVDAPCSNTGVLARRVEARWRFDPRDVRRQATDQRHILTLAATFARPGGRLVYSSCSFEPEENAQVVAAGAKAGLRVE
jgi:16S rRNA (cytosine967-C5)-methyltransferase